MKKKSFALGLVPLLLCGFFLANRGATESEDKPRVIPRPVITDPNPVVAIASGSDYAKTTLEAINKAGGLESIVKPGKSVFIKVNIVGPSPSGAGRITDWRVVQAVIDECNRLGASKVMVGESPVDCSWEVGFRTAGYFNIKGAELIDINAKQEDCYALLPERSLIGQPLYLAKLYMDSDVVIDIPVLKTHYNAGVTLGLKNLGIGMPPINVYRKGGNKTKLHDLGINKVIPDVSQIRKPDFTVIDGMVGGEGMGPTNPTPVKSNLVIASKDVVAADTVGTLVMGFDPYKVTSIVYAAAAGIGVMDPGQIKITDNKMADVQQDYEAPPNSGYPFKSTTVIREADVPIKIDGKLDEWGGAWPNRIAKYLQYSSDEYVKNWRDFSGRAMAFHDWSNLYFAFNVNDDVLVPAKNYSDVYEPKGDGVEMFFSFDMPFEDNVNAARHERSGGKDFILLAGVDPKGIKVYNQDTNKSIAGVKAAYAKTKTGYSVEVKIPLESLGQDALKLREELWMDFGMTDVDKPGKEEPTRAIWGGGILQSQYDDPSTTGRALVDAAKYDIPVS